MRFRIQGEKEKIDDKVTTIIEVLGKKAIEKLIDDKLLAIFKDLEKQILELKRRVDKLEEEVAIKRRTRENY